MEKARFDVYHNLIQENSSDQGKLFGVSKQLLNHRFDFPFPPHSRKAMLGSEINLASEVNFFFKKISDIRSKFKNVSSGIVTTVHLSWIHILRHLIVSKQLQKTGLTMLS